MKKIHRLVRPIVTSLAFVPLLSTSFNADAARLLPFQGRLTDANGQAVADGARVVQFKIYDAPVGGRAVWNGEVQKLSVNGGLVSTILGSKADLATVDFNRQVYLEITVDANADGLITPADPPLLPRQSILPAVFSAESANSRQLEGYSWSALFGTNNPADGTFVDSKIADGSLATTKLRDGSITAPKIADGAVTRSKISTDGALAGQALTYNGTDVVWNQVTASDSAHLNGFDWSALFNNGNPATGSMSVAGLNCRGSSYTSGDLLAYGRVYLNGPTTLVQGLLYAPSIGINMSMNDWGLYLRGVGDNNHVLKYGNAHGGTTGFDGPILQGLAGGVLGTVGAWSLRWNSSGTVQTRGTLTSGSDRNLKEHFQAVDPQAVLAKVAELPITRWNYITDPGAEHIGPVAQDFRAAFGLGTDDKSIAVVDGDGVALAAIKGLNSKVEHETSRLAELVRQQQEQIEALKAEISRIKAGH